MSKQKKTQATETTMEQAIATSTTLTLAEKIQALMNQGKTLEEALTELKVAEGKTTTPRMSTDDRLAYIKGLENVTELRKARKTAYAKKSKAKGSKNEAETLPKYEAEIEAATTRLNELLAIINSAEVPYLKALELGETKEGALQYFIQDKEQEVEDSFKRVDGTKAAIKAFVQASEVRIDWVPEDLKEAYTERVHHNDQRLITLAQRVTALEDIQKGTRKVSGDKTEAA